MFQREQSALRFFRWSKPVFLKPRLYAQFAPGANLPPGAKLHPGVNLHPLCSVHMSVNCVHMLLDLLFKHITNVSVLH